MINHIYVYFSDYKYLKELREELFFINPFEYLKSDYDKLRAEEYGKIRLKSGDFIHFLFDLGRCENCPWCDFPDPEFKEVHPEQNCSLTSFDKFYMECPRCLARGPVLNVNPIACMNKIYLEEIRSIVTQRWTQRIPKKIEEVVK